ncbi:MAG: relaxase/mobilization nuclease domain-containing protein [Saprospiraceae bacterium]|nr:relaxase/mobilization nuclease domain-containing protein [Candidatus Defluviibacterium haderslevense]
MNYVLKPEKNEKAEPILKHNLRSRSPVGWTKEFESNEALRLYKRSDNIKLNHMILSFSSKDIEHISKDLLKDISKKFIELRGKDNVYLASSHHDKDHIHLHILMSATKYLTGESNRISKLEFQDLKLGLDAYQKDKYPELIHSLPAHGKLTKVDFQDISYPFKASDKTLSQKQQISENIAEIYGKVNTSQEFLSQLKFEGLEPYYRGGTVYGVEDQGRHFKFKTLGFDINKLDELDKNQSKVEVELQDLKDLRESKNLEKEVNDERNIEDDEDEETEDELGNDEYDGLGI